METPAVRRVMLTISWSETAHYNQDIEIDVPVGYTGEPTDLIFADDSPDNFEDLEGIPDGFTTKWVDRADWNEVESVYDRQVHDVTTHNEKKEH